MVNTAAFFDTLVLTDRISRRIGSVVGPEVHLFAYLACLLAVYRGWPATDWGYRFACTDNGAPYSHDLQNAIEELLALGHLSSNEDIIALSEDGRDLQGFLSSLETQQWRLPYLDGACSSLLGMPVGVVRYAISSEPTIRRATTLSRNQLLLDDMGQELVYEEFARISAAVGAESPDLIVPAVTWLTTLVSSARALEAQ